MATRNKTALITGCSANGIGAALASELANQGHHVFATARNVAKIPTELREHENVTTIKLDVTSTESIAEALIAVRESGRSIDILVNNAGGAYTMPVLDIDVDQAKALYDVLYWGPLRMVQTFSDMLIANKGRIVNISSIGGVLYTPWISTYSSAKAALNVLSETLRLELSPMGVSVVCILAGRLATQFQANEPIVVLPETSYYTSILNTIKRWSKAEAGPTPGPLGDFITSIVPDVLGERKNGIFWRGPNVGAVWFAIRWLPTYIVDQLLSNDQGLEEVKLDLMLKRE